MKRILPLFLLLVTGFTLKAQLFTKTIDTIGNSPSSTLVTDTNYFITFNNDKYWDSTEQKSLYSISLVAYDKNFNKTILKTTTAIRSGFHFIYEGEPHFVIRPVADTSILIWKTDGSSVTEVVRLKLNSMGLFGYYQGKLIMPNLSSSGVKSLWSYHVQSGILKKILDSTTVYRVNLISNKMYFTGKHQYLNVENSYMFDGVNDSLHLLLDSLNSRPGWGNGNASFIEFQGSAFLTSQYYLAPIDTATGSLQEILPANREIYEPWGWIEFNSFLIPSAIPNERSEWLEYGYTFENGKLIKKKHGMYLLYEEDRVNIYHLNNYYPLANYNVTGKYFFRYDDGVNGSEPWISDLTKKGTYMLKDLSSHTLGSIPEFVPSNGNVTFFKANDYAGLHVTDGTSAGTRQINKTGKFKIPVYAYCNDDIAWGNGIVTYKQTRGKQYNRQLSIEYFAQYGVPLHGEVYHDINGNGQRDSGEPGVFNQRIGLNNGNATVGTDSYGKVYGFVENTDYTANILLDKNWKLTSSPKEYKLKKDSIHLVNLSYGIQSEKDVVDFDVAIAARRMHCARGKAGIRITNTGTKAKAPIARVLLDHLSTITYSNMVYTLDTIDTLVYVSFKLPIIQPFFSQNIVINYRLLGAGGNNILENKVTVMADTMAWKDSVRYFASCSFDPNDKAIEPIGPRNDYSLLPEDFDRLRYTIRFQNLGNDTAYDVTVYDTFHRALDPSTVKLESTSHNATYSVEGDVVKFYFKDILLPDSATDSAGSNGSLVFSVKPRSGYLHKTEITNKAGIVFDVNTPVITNTTRSILLRSLPIVSPTIVRGEFLREDRVEVSWKRVESNVDSVILFRAVNDSMNYLPILKTSANATFHEDYDVSKSSTYYYKLMAFNSYEHGESAVYKVSYPVGLNDVDLTELIKIYPSPAQSQLNIQITNNQAGQLILFDINGKQMLQQAVSGNSVIEVGHLPKGPYLLKVKVCGQQMEKLISLQ